MRVTPSQVSKAIARLEGALRLRLLTRGARGVALSEAGLRVAPEVEQTVARLNGLRGSDARADREITIASPSWLCLALVPRIAGALGDLRVRGIELPPSLMRALAGENIFDLALLPGSSERLPATWASHCVGDVRKGLFACPALAKELGGQPVSEERLAGIPFIGHIFNASGAFVAVDDDCPLPRAARTIGHEAQTFRLGLELAVHTRQLVFGPVLGARGHVERGELVEVRVRGWDVREPLHLACDGGRVLARVQTAISRAVAQALGALERQ
jgi:DNA-binding transcriptional LysR family regulator